MNTYTKSMTKEEISKLEHKLMSSECEKRKTPPYAIFQYKTSDCTITAYESGKVVFQGEGASFYVENTSSTKSNGNLISTLVPSSIFVSKYTPLSFPEYNLIRSLTLLIAYP